MMSINIGHYFNGQKEQQNFNKFNCFRPVVANLFCAFSTPKLYNEFSKILFITLVCRSILVVHPCFKPHAFLPCSKISSNDSRPEAPHHPLNTSLLLTLHHCIWSALKSVLKYLKSDFFLCIYALWLKLSVCYLHFLNVFSLFQIFYGKFL